VPESHIDLEAINNRRGNVAACHNAPLDQPLAMTVAFTTFIGGIVVFGSTTTTAKQTSASIKEAEALRTDLISNLELRIVRERQQ
jgi:hypothetical protein